MLVVHPGVHSPMDVVIAGLLNENFRHCNSKSRIEGITYNVNEMDNCFQLLLEVPGVKKSDVKVQLLRRSVLQVTAERNFPQKQNAKRIYKQSFVLDPKLADTSKITSELENGVLVLQVMKRIPDTPVDVSVELSNPPSNDSTDFVTVLTIDLPGVKSSDLKLQYVDGKIMIDAKRKRGSDFIEIKKSAIVNEINSCALTDFKSYLNDGVLTVMARKSAIDDTKHDDTTNVPISGLSVESKTSDEKPKLNEQLEDNDVVIIDTVTDNKKK